MDDNVPFLRYSRKKSRSAAGEACGKTKNVETDSKLKDQKDEATLKSDGHLPEGQASKGKRSMSTGKPKSKGGEGAISDLIKKGNEDMKTPWKRKRGADVEITLACLSSLERSASRLRPRKEVPSFRMIELCDNDNRRIIGKRVKVYWSGSRRWFVGRVKAFHYRKRLHTILYEDGDKEELDLRKERFELEILPSEDFHLITQSCYGKKVTVKKDNDLNEDAIRSISESQTEKESEDAVRTDAVMVPEMADAVSDARGTGHADSSKISEEEDDEATKMFGAQVTERVSHSKLNDTMFSDDFEGEKVLKDISKEEEDEELMKRGARSKKNMAIRDSSISSSKSRGKEGSKEVKNTDLDEDVRHDFANSNSGHNHFDVEDCHKVDDQKDGKAEFSAEKAIKNHVRAYETKLSNPDSDDSSKEENCFYDVQVNWEIGDHIEKEASNAVGVLSRDINFRWSRTVKTYNDVNSFSKAAEKKSENRKSGEKGGEAGKAENNCNAESLKNPVRRKRSAVIMK